MLVSEIFFPMNVQIRMLAQGTEGKKVKKKRSMREDTEDAHSVREQSTQSSGEGDGI